MKAQLKEMYSLQIPEALKEFLPEASKNFGITIRLMVGVEGVDQSESFDILVCTPTWIQDQLILEKYMWGRHMLIVNEYDYELIFQSLSARISSYSGKDWNEVANKIARIAAWEFEDYRSPDSYG